MSDILGNLFGTFDKVKIEGSYEPFKRKKPQTICYDE